MSNNPSYNYIQDIVHFILQQNIYVMDIIYLPLFKIKYTILNYLHNILYNMQNRMINQFNILLLELYCLIPIQNLNRLLYIMIHIIFNQYYIKHMDIILPFHHIYFLSAIDEFLMDDHRAVCVLQSRFDTGAGLGHLQV